MIATFVKRAVTRRGETDRGGPAPGQDYGVRALAAAQPGTDVAWINGMMHVIIKEDLHDKSFIEERTENFDGREGGGRKIHPGARGGDQRDSGRAADRGGTPLRQGSGRQASCTAWASPSTSPAPTTSSPWPTWPCSAATWASGGRRQPLARPEQRPGGLRHGRPPQRLSGYQAVDNLAAVKRWSRPGTSRSADKAGLTVTEMVPKPTAAKSRPSMLSARTRLLPTLDLQPCQRACGTRFSGGAGSLPHRDREAGRRRLSLQVSPRKMAPSPTRSGGCSGWRKAVFPPGQAKADWKIILRDGHVHGLCHVQYGQRDHFTELPS